jgi:hypothetical protein
MAKAAARQDLRRLSQNVRRDDHRCVLMLPVCACAHTGHLGRGSAQPTAARDAVRDDQVLERVDDLGDPPPPVLTVEQRLPTPLSPRVDGDRRRPMGSTPADAQRADPAVTGSSRPGDGNPATWSTGRRRDRHRVAPNPVTAMLDTSAGRQPRSRRLGAIWRQWMTPAAQHGRVEAELGDDLVAVLTEAWGVADRWRGREPGAGRGSRPAAG